MLLLPPLSHRLHLRVLEVVAQEEAVQVEVVQAVEVEAQDGEAMLGVEDVEHLRLVSVVQSRIQSQNINLLRLLLFLYLKLLQPSLQPLLLDPEALEQGALLELERQGLEKSDIKVLTLKDLDRLLITMMA